MRSMTFFSLAISAFWLLSGVPLLQATPHAQATRQAVQAADLQLPFVPNQGQVDDPAVAYVADTFAGRVAITRQGEIVYNVPQGKAGRPAAIHERLVGADIKVQALDKTTATVSMYPGRDRSQW